MQTLASFPFLTLHLHTGGPWAVLEAEWLGFAGSTDFRQALTEAVRLARQHHARAWVADDRRLGAVRPKDLEWAGVHVLEALAGLGMQRFARLESEQALNRLTINSLLRASLPGLPYEFRHFTSLPEARAWAAGA